ncbi:MAG: tRNA uridine-5-carboxymethylaminomethyl(34) synthesis GTPase MnmE [Flavobacteriales bacterium]|nr:tRNA uridine-5-carboxymethylaminomethyl(34) synthesis GTPase MnmE [Flavobacteriales bacterium]
MINNEDICAISTGTKLSAISVIRVSGPNAINICDNFFKSASNEKKLINQKSHTSHYGYFFDNGIIDEVIYNIFKAPNSYTGENTVEISCHGSPYIQENILNKLVRNGCRIAKPGEFTFRSFINGKIDLSQAEAVADLISSKTEKSHKIAISQLRGGYSNKLSKLRKDLIKFASLIELELDFSQEDLEFVNRDQLLILLDELKQLLEKLINSFNLGNAIKNGISVAIVGEPNVGKSTLLNLLSNENKSIVSDIPGTTRDIIEDQINIDGYSFRFFDTAGIRSSNDKIEKIGIDKTFDKIEKSSLVIYLFDIRDSLIKVKADIKKLQDLYKKQIFIPVANKFDLIKFNNKNFSLNDLVIISAKDEKNIDLLKSKLTSKIKLDLSESDDFIVSNARHLESLNNSLKHIFAIKEGIKNKVFGEFLAMDLREALNYIGQITGEITNDNLLDSIFKDFCIGK